MTKHLDRADSDTLRISLVWSVVWVFAFGVLFVSVSSPATPLSARLPILYLTVFFYGTAYIAWSFDHWRPIISRWFLCLTLALLINLGIGWLNQPAFMMLMFVPVILARAHISLAASVVTAAFESGLLLLVPRLFPIDLGPLALAFALTIVWTTVGLMFAMYRPMYQILTWALDHYEQARILLEEARDRKAELQAARDELMRTNRELLLLNERMQILRQEADSARKAKALFVAKVSHEFRTPLNMIIGLADLLIETPEIYGERLPDTLLDDLHIVQRNCKHLSDLVEDVLSLGQMEAGTLALNLEWVDINEEIDLIMTVVQPLVDKKHLYIRTSEASPVPPVMCDRVRIRQVLLNLVSNAVRFTSAGGITVGILREGDDVVLSVSDTGAGIRGEDTERIFEPFFQSSTPGESRGGSGLGLSISRQFVELHHGQMWVESALGLGTTFYIRLPITPPRTVDSIAQRWLQENWVWQQRTSPVTLPRSPHKERVMVFDDTGSLAPVIARLRSDLEFVEVRSLDEAEQRLADVPAHVFLANVPTPAHLLTFAESAQKRISDTPIVVCSYQTLLERPLQAGASGYLTKPVVADKLVAALRTLSTPIRKVLIVDDNEDLQRLLARMLRSYDGSLQIATVADGRDALPEIRRLQPDLILLDLALPNLDGWQILEQKAADPAICDITTLIISAQDLAEQPMRSPQFVVGMQGGTAPKQLLESALLLSRVLLGAT